MRNRTPPSFTVETKSGGRHQRTFIPHRAVAPAIPRPAVSWPPPAEPRAPAAEPRRILPSLIMPEPVQAELEPTSVADEHALRPRRGRPPKAKPCVVEMTTEPITEPVIEIAPVQAGLAPAPPLRTSAAPVMRATKPPAVLPPGERWKRRLGQWAR